MIFELCAGCYEDAKKASSFNIKRIELNSALYLGGLTPTIGTLKRIKKDFPELEVITMNRVRAGGFVYSEEEYTTMLEDLKILLDNGADGISFGFLTSDYHIDEKRTKEFVDIIHGYGKTAVFHRAFDMSSLEEVKVLEACHVDRILTSGFKPTALEGIESLKELVKSTSIEILAGSGVNAGNIHLFKEAGLRQVHGSCGGTEIDVTSNNGTVSFDYAAKQSYEACNTTKLEQVKRVLEMC